MSTTNVSLAVGGMSCGHCVASVTKALATVPGIADAVRAIQESGYNASAVRGPSGAA